MNMSAGKTLYDLYKSKLVTAAEAVGVVKSGDTIWYGTFNGQPIDCDKALAARKDELSNVIIQSAGALPPAPQVALVDPNHEHFAYHSWYFTALDRALCDMGNVFYCTINYHECKKVVEELGKNDVAILQVAPMDEHGFFNFGPNASHHYSVTQSVSKLIVEVNTTVPRCLGGFGEGVHVSDVDFIVEGNNTPIFEYPPNVMPSANEEKIASYVVEHIEDRSCIQVGIGGLPASVSHMIAQSDIRDLGVHSEMFVDSFVDLIESGKINGKYKNLDRGKINYTFSIATRKTYDFMNNNPMLASCPGHYTNDPKIICQNDKVVAVNNAVELDLYSQVCAESYGTRQISGTGGQLDFMQGAFESNGGKSFICLTSTRKDKNGNLVSRIKPHLQQGAIVTTPRSVVMYVVTENGIVMLKGKSTWERAEALVSIAHPAFQDELVREAEKMGIWKKSNKKV
jgi:butyryl-CoA:acetate CoA-transferase